MSIIILSRILLMIMIKRICAGGYLPDVDDVLASQTGICFDYAAVMASMLRCERIPTRLEVGYMGDVYHAWMMLISKIKAG